MTKAQRILSVCSLAAGAVLGPILVFFGGFYLEGEWTCRTGLGIMTGHRTGWIMVVGGIYLIVNASLIYIVIVFKNK